ncbi:MAG: Hsp70 family protein [Pseudanabaenaceae cyanobacterium]
MLYAIDFGTSNTVVACNHTCVSLPGLSRPDSPLIPSLIYVESLDRYYVGQAVKEKGVEKHPHCFAGIKRGIGQKFAFLPQIDGQAITFEWLGKCFLQRVLQELTDRSSLVFTVPIDSYETYGAWLADVAEDDQVRILDEPTAAALGYGVPEAQSRLLVIDFGGGTLDIVLVERQPPDGDLGWGNILRWYQRKETKLKPSARVLAKVGENLGGLDIDRWIVQHFPDLPCTQETLQLAEQLKIRLSQQETATVYWQDRPLHLDRATLQEILTAKRFFQRLEQALSKIPSQKIERVLLVGGTSLMPAVQEWVKEKFNNAQVDCDRPLEAIALGALKAGEWELEDRLYHDYGIRYWDKRLQQHNWHPIIRKGQTYPLTYELVLGASTPNQRGIELIIGELGEATTEIIFERGQLVNRLLEQPYFRAVPLNDSQPQIASLDPPGQPGSDRVQLTFTVDNQRTLRLKVVDLLTGQTLLADQPLVKLL